MAQAKIGVLYVHGVGMQGQNFASDDITAIKRSLGEHANNVAFASYCWQSLIEPREQAIMTNNRSIGWKWLRRFMASYGGDALCYQPRHGLESFYAEVHQGLDAALAHLSASVAVDGKLVIVAHSLGTIIVNNFIWDWQNEDSVGAAVYALGQRGSDMLSKLSVLYTLGSPLAIWALRYPTGGKPIVLSQCHWRNVYCPSDIIGWPIRGINAEYGALTHATDYCVRVGGLLTRWTPMSHLYYGGNRKVVRMLTDDIIQLLE